MFSCFYKNGMLPFILIIIGVLQLRQDDRLREENMVKLIESVLEQLPLISNVIKMLKNGK